MGKYINFVFSVHYILVTVIEIYVGNLVTDNMICFQDSGYLDSDWK